ncbi:Uncharacterised protein [Kluyvera cryocrescens]|uniref:Uncharacterized protein n=1 Tax=Kluyvera cryocrescens TaxID=580 RepID=A0A485AQ30_KLUCR|nr:Uncharacterised protein [Kluyvera cryocrescens]
MMTTSIESARGDISIRRLRKTFSLEGKPFDVFRDLNLHIDSGQSIAIVGPKRLRENHTAAYTGWFRDPGRRRCGD